MPITICGGISDIRRRGTYATRPQGPAQRVTSINIGGEVNPYQLNSINIDILIGIHDDDQDILKPNIYTFYSSCPLYKQIYVIIKSLREYLPNARAALQHNTKTRILLIVLLKVKKFSQVKMVGTKGCLGEFTDMVNQLTAKNCEIFSYIEVPTELLRQGENRKKTSTK